MTTLTIGWDSTSGCRANHYETVLAADAAQAVSAAKKDRPDLVLLDLRLPADDGFVVMEQFRASAELSVIPVIVITILNSAHDRALEAGAVAFFQKPADNAALLAAIRRALGEVSFTVILNTRIAGG